MALTISAGCGPAPQRLPNRVHIALIDATIAPGTAQGKSWDGSSQVSFDVLQNVSKLLATMPTQGRVQDATRAGAVVAEIGAAIASRFVPPDPKGYVDLLVAGTSRRLVLREQQDTFHPTWAGIAFDQVPLVEGLRMRVQLFDADDFGSDDPIGTAELTYDDIVEALSYEQVVQIRVDSQTQGQLLFLGISVTGR